MVTARAGTAAAAVAGRTAILAGVWWVLAEGTGTGWGMGVAAVAIAVGVTLWLQPPGRLAPRLRAVPAFAVWFVRHSVAGGVDVARRAVRRSVDLDPAVLVLPVRLPEGWPRVVLADVVSLLPGTLAVSLRSGRLELHVLDATRPVARDVRGVEERVARLFGITLEE